MPNYSSFIHPFTPSIVLPSVQPNLGLDGLLQLGRWQTWIESVGEGSSCSLSSLRVVRSHSERCGPRCRCHHFLPVLHTCTPTTSPLTVFICLSVENWISYLCTNGSLGALNSHSCGISESIVDERSVRRSGCELLVNWTGGGVLNCSWPGQLWIWASGLDFGQSRFVLDRQVYWDNKIQAFTLTAHLRGEGLLWAAELHYDSGSRSKWGESVFFLIMAWRQLIQEVSVAVTIHSPLNSEIWCRSPIFLTFIYDDWLV